MHHDLTIGVVVPVYNEAQAIGQVIAALRALTIAEQPVIDAIVVCDNGSTDATAQIAVAAGAMVVKEPQRGYGAACQAALRALPAVDVVVFADGDAADDVQDILLLLDEISKESDLVIGSRTKLAQPGALLWQQRVANWIILRLIQGLYGRLFTDLGPLRAIRYSALQRLQMQDRDYGWMVEMQLKAVQMGLAIKEVDVQYRRRIGRSKISGSWRGFVAAWKICVTILKLKGAVKKSL